MGTYSFDYNKAKNRLYVSYEGFFTKEEAVKYVEETKKYVTGKQIKTILVDSIKLKPLPEEITVILSGMMDAPEITASWKGSAVVLESAILKAFMGQSVKKNKFDKANISYFKTIEEGDAFLDTL